MQSGISASAELHDAFRNYTSTSSHFALPITISSERLVPQETIPFSSSSPDFYSSLPLLEKHLNPSTPIYLVLRKEGKHVAVTYIPSRAPVRSKTLFASTRATLVRELGTEKFEGGILFVTEPEEILEEKEWRDREKRSGADGEDRDEALLTREERELGAVKRAEEEERFGTRGRDIGYGGGNGNASGDVTVSGGGRLMMKVTDEAKDKLRGGLAESGDLVILGIDVPTETINLVSSHSSVSTAEVSNKIPPSQPSYAFYRYPQTSTILFAYTCPSGMSIKERMLYASSRNGALLIAKAEGVEVSKRIEAGAPDELDEHRLSGEIKSSETEDSSGPSAGTARQGFARPKRPGKR